ncbi:DUF2194 domain-containing protein [Roseivirga sp.]|uniref:DUF2194 domain-containing protein n=1 Tax=Roseivirga sp. TaxID=1964215 RepID=UPI002B27946B|nr:DUF2194 domain-containing protein [Roseivirga sp.]
MITLVGCGDFKDKESKKELEESPTEFNPIIEPLVVFIHLAGSELSDSYSGHIGKVMDYTKIPFKEVSLRSFNNAPTFKSTPKVILIDGTGTGQLNEKAIDYLVGFVGQGGTLIFTSANEDQRMGYLSGLKQDATFAYDLEAKGFDFVKNVLPGLGSVKLYINRNHTSLAKENFKPNVNVLATAISDRGLPIIMENMVGNGKVINFNTTIKLERSDRGLLFAAILSGLEGVPYPIVNTSTIFIDDFPTPTYGIKSEPIKSEFDLTQAEYVTNVWWPDMIKVSKRFGIAYSAYPTFNFNEIKSPPFLFNEWDAQKTIRNGKQLSASVWMSKEVLKNEFELGIHGYNHESLMKEIWDNPENIDAAFKATRKKWTVDRFGKYPKSYVAPSNYIDSMGLVHLKRVMPEIEFMSTTYGGELIEGGGRDFDPDPFEPGLFDYPRITSGYVFTDREEYFHQSLYLYTGIWTHFIHPDDVFQLPTENNNSAGEFDYRNRDGLNWYKAKGDKQGMLSYWTDYLQKVKTIHPTTRFLTATEGGTITRNWRNSDYEYGKSGDFYSVRKSSANNWNDKEFYWFVFAKEENADAMENAFSNVVDTYTKTALFGGTLFTLKTPKPELLFEDIKWKQDPLFDLSEVKAMVTEDYQNYVLERAAIASGYLAEDNEQGILEEEVLAQMTTAEDSVAWFVANDQLGLATNILRKELMRGDVQDTSIFNKYVLYKGYQDRSMDVWTFMEEIYQDRSESLALGYLSLYLKKEAFPNEELTERWLYRRIFFNIHDEAAIKDYFTFFYSTEYNPQIKEVLAHLNDKNPTPENYARYIQYIIDFEPVLLTGELLGKNPEELPLLWPKATTIAYTYSDESRIQEALLWSDYSDEIPMITVLQWWIELEAFNKMESVYHEYIVEHPEDQAVKAFVSSAWYDIGEYERSALVANQLPEGNEKKIEIEKRFNPDVIYFDADIQKFLIDRTPELFSAETLHTLKKELRYNENNSIEVNTAYMEDNFSQSVWESDATFNLRTEQGRQHSFSITHSSVSDLVLTDIDPQNLAHELYGLRYRFQTANIPTKPFFSFSAGLQQDNFNKMFVGFGASISKSKENVFKSLSLDFAPVKTGVGISKEVYKSEMIGYYERGSTKFWQSSFVFLGSHYTNGGLEAALTSRLYANLKREEKSRFSPFAELFVSAANRNQENGNPYWIIDSRLYGGGGFAWTYGKNERKLKARIESGYFFDSYVDGFLRVTGNLSFPIKEYTFVTGQFELFNQSLYYSNSLQIGFKHFLDRKRKYTYKQRPY